MNEIDEVELRVALVCDNCGNRYEWRPRTSRERPTMPCPGCGERRLARVPILKRGIGDWNWVAILWVFCTVVLASMGVYLLVNGR